MNFNFNAAEVFDIAVQIEENGKRFYDRSRQIVEDPGVQKLFEDLGQAEVKHRETFLSLKSQLPTSAASGGVFDPNDELSLYIKMMADQHVFISGGDIQARLAQIKNSVDALKMAIEFEKDTVIFFLSMQDATDSARGKEFIGSLVREEMEHLRRLSVELKRIGRK